jgi:integrase
LALSPEIIQEWKITNSESVDISRMKWFLNTLYKLGVIYFKSNWSNVRSNRIKAVSKVIQEQIKYKLDYYLEELESPIFLIFKLIEAFGLRSCEIAKIPLNCLTSEGEMNGIFIRRGKQKDRKEKKALLKNLVPLIQKQQSFIRQNFGNDFPWLFSNFTLKCSGFPAKVGFPPQFVYHPELIIEINRKLNKLLKLIIEHYNIRTNDGALAKVTTHSFRHTWATVAKRMGKRVDQIQDALGHLNFDMQDTYVNETPQEREKKIVLVNKDGKEIVYKTDRDRDVIRREWKIREIELGLCGRPNIHKSCENDYICFDCPFAYYTQEHLPQLESYLKHNQNILKKAEKDKQTNSIRANAARQIIVQVTRIIQKLNNCNV